jgi:hypothetical protein
MISGNVSDYSTLGVTMLPPVNIDPKNKAMIDALMDVTERDRSRRAWSFWLTVGGASLVVLWCVRYEFLPNLVRLVLAVVGGLGLLLFLFFLSTKPFGRGYYAGPAWWWF